MQARTARPWVQRMRVRRPKLNGTSLVCTNARCRSTAPSRGGHMTQIPVALAAFGLIAVGCDGTSAKQPRIAGSLLDEGVVHRVSVGSHDVVPPGTDANFSLIA